MPIAYSYREIDDVSGDDLLIISDKSTSYRTKSMTVEQLSNYFGNSVVRQAKKVLGPDEILSLSGPTPQFLEFVPAPGENKLLMPINMGFELEFVSTPYNLAGTHLQIVLNSFSIGFQILNNVLNVSQTVYGWDLSGSNLNGTSSPIVNQPLNFTVNGGTVSQGDSILTVSMLYRIIDFS